MEVRGRRSRDMSPERVKICTQSRLIRPAFKKVQVVYYLTRNGQLEHPHYLEVTHLANQQLRLKDVIDRLTVLRGKAMPSLYSWSCKRSYKNGYVWNDLAENDIIYPSEGAEYVLKGSEIVSDGCTEKFQQLRVGSSTQQNQQLPLGNVQQRPGVVEITNCHPKRRSLGHVHHHNNEYEDNDQNEAGQVEEEELDHEEEYEEKISCYTTSTTPQYSRCSRGVSTDEIHHRHQRPQKQEQKKQKQESQETMKNPRSEFILENESPPSTTSSSLSDKAMNETSNTSKRFEDGDPVGNEPLLSRNSMLFQLIACGGSLSFRGTTNGKNVPDLKQQQQPPPATTTTAATPAGARRSNCSDLHKGVLCKSAAAGYKAAAAMEEEDEIKYMSENPRFGNLQAEEKEYFSGSIVESMATDDRAQVEPSSLKKSSSYNEERSSKLAIEDAEATEEERGEKALKGKCIPRKRSSSKQAKK
ncbi:protein SOSEKI 2-like [Coffea arabica]|uniref:Protein SOSEKI 2-like n=1 Tax=Coffea arabica TaxID=13443 RepID=A0A6P6TGK2_COFAR|nr:protein UPSTREAM OF FLC-like [Coffea arabica]